MISKPVNHTLSMIGHTPLLQVSKLDTGPCELFLKLEYQNPGGSIKDRIAVQMIQAAEQEGQIKPGDLLVEATAGNTGLGLALVAKQKGYRLRIVMPDKMSQEKVFNLKSMGAEVEMTRSDVGKGHPDYYQDKAERIAKEAQGFFVNQFANPNNWQAHYDTTAPEIWQQLEGKVDAFVCGVGSGGTLTGVGRFLKEKRQSIQLILADPKGSVLKHYVETGELVQAGSWLVEGIGEDFIPPICEIDLVDKAYEVSDGQSFATCRQLLKEQGIMGGSSTGTLLFAALQYCRAQKTKKRVVTLVPDSGNKYLSKMYNDFWMQDQGFIQRQTAGDISDLIARHHRDHATVVVGQDESLLTAFSRMKLYDISQLPVMDHDKIVGIIDESDILYAVQKDQEQFYRPVAEAMTSRLEPVSRQASIEDLMPIFARDHVAIVLDGQEFLGFITRIDLLHYLRRKLP